MTEHRNHLSWAQRLDPPAKPVGPSTAVYNASIWTIVLIVSLVLWALADGLGAYLLDVVLGVAVYDLGVALYQLMGFGLAVVLLALAIADWRMLRRNGFVRPFHWAWGLLPAVYVVGRSIIVHRQSGRGLWPARALAAVAVGSIGLMIVKAIIA